MTDVCKRHLCQVIDDLVLSPFSMSHSTFSQSLLKNKINDVAFGYNAHDLQIPGGFNIMPELAAAGLWTVPSDLALFGIEIMKALKNESTFLKKETVELITTKAYDNSPFGIGFELSESKKGLIFGHSGENIGYNSTMLFSPKDGSGIVVMQNSDIGWHIPDEVTHAFKEIYGW